MSTDSATRRVLLVVNPSSKEAHELLPQVVDALIAAGVQVALTDDDHDQLLAEGGPQVAATVVPVASAASGVDLVVVLGGDGTVLRAVELSRGSDAPLFAVNLGHVGFLAEAEPEDLHSVLEAITHRRWVVDERMTLDVKVITGGQVQSTWALNEIAIEKRARERMVDILVEVDGRPLSRWGCDGVVCATPTGSTAYAFSAGGPVVWPEVSAMLVVPLSAHALFARPLVVSPTSVVAFELGSRGAALLSADGRRMIDVEPGSRIEVRQNREPVRLARLANTPFTNRLVMKFDLPVEGWRGRKPEGA